MRSLTVLWMSLLGSVSSGAELDAAAAHRGRGLFDGSVPLHGKVVGHANDVPSAASRCVNCHSSASALPARAVAASAAASDPRSTSFGPLLTPQGLTAPTPRRGGPPSRYDEASFCAVLRTGVDPAYVMVKRAMPRYELSDADCHALWAHLMKAE